MRGMIDLTQTSLYFWKIQQQVSGEMEASKINLTSYFNTEEATSGSSSIDSNGRSKTGDFRYIKDDGFIFVVDRVKDLIKFKGHKITPSELEALLLGHPEIVDAAVIPYPDKEVGNYPMAYVVRKSGSEISASAVTDFIDKKVAPYKRIRRVEFVTSIPRNSSGKILRKDLIKHATSKL